MDSSNNKKGERFAATNGGVRLGFALTMPFRGYARFQLNLDFSTTLRPDHRRALEADGLVVFRVPGAAGLHMEGFEKRRRRQDSSTVCRAPPYSSLQRAFCAGDVVFERGMEHSDSTPVSVIERA